MADPTLTSIASTQGDALAMHDWPVPLGAPIRGVVVVLHSVGEHAARYEDVARRLNQWGFSVRGYDQYGHGESGGPRGGLPNDDRLLVDLADVVDATRIRLPDGVPLILLGHSMGGLVVGRFVALKRRPVDALVMSSPALDPGLSAVQKLLLAIVPKIAPNLRVGNGLNADYISHDPATIAAYRADPLVHDRISGRLAKFIADGGPATVARAAQWTVPTLLMYAGGDRLVNPAGSRAFAAAAPKAVVTAHCFPEHYHELFNELEREPVFAMLESWLDARFPA